MQIIGEDSADCNAVIKQENERNDILDMEDRLRELEARNAMLESRVVAMGDVIAKQAAMAQQQVQPPLAVDQSPEPPVMNGAAPDVPAGRFTHVSVRESLGLSSLKNYNEI